MTIDRSSMSGVGRSRELAIGSLCTGYGGLDLAVDEVLGGSLVWYSEIEPAPANVMAHHYPNVPNVGDLTVPDLAPERVDILTAGYPCQPFSHAGKRKGTTDERHLWPHIANIVRLLRPGIVVLENVAGHLSLGLDVVLADLAALGFDAEWGVLRASDVGACHGRARVFILALDASGQGLQGKAVGRVQPGEPMPRRGSPSDADEREGGERHRPAVLGGRQGEAEQAGLGGSAAADAGHRVHGDDSRGVAGASASRERSGQGESRRPRAGREDAPDSDRSGPQGAEPAEGRDVPSWGDYADAIERHERVLGRPAPRPVDDRGRLSPQFVEWMQMLPEGWVTDIEPSRPKALKMLGNGVVPPQAAHALRGLLARASDRAEVAA